MYFEIDLSVVPPTTTLREADDFRSLKVVVVGGDHARVPVAVFEELAGEKADDPHWREGFDSMLGYAREHGWVDDTGVRAHIELPA